MTDPAEIAGQGAQTEVAAEQGAASGAEVQEQPQDPIRALFNRVKGVFGSGGESEQDASGVDPEAKADEGATEEKPQAAIPEDERIRREAQRLADQEIAKREWTRAVAQADRGDTSALREMAEKGDGRAQRELAKRGETFELGEARAKELQEAEAEQASGQVLQAIGREFDSATVLPLMTALPEAARAAAQKAFEDAGGGLNGRKALVEKALALYEKHVTEQADESFLDRMGKDQALRKRVMAKIRGSDDFDEPDLIAAASAGGKQSMDDWLREAAGFPR